METKVSPAASTGSISSSSPPPSCASSPSHEFSFTISFHPSPRPPKTLTATTAAIDLSPADEIFFHGHLLPLQLVSHAPPSNPPFPTFPPRHSTTPHAEAPTKFAVPNTTGNASNSKVDATNREIREEKTVNPKPASRAPFYSLFGGVRGKSRKPEEEEKKKKLSFDVGRILKKYAVVLETLLFSRGASKEKTDVRKRPYSFSGSSSWKGRDDWTEARRNRWGQFSAPASMRTSPNNSGRLTVNAQTTGVGYSEESTMEELQNAIQAAIAHCKNSIATKEDKCDNIQTATANIGRNHY